MQIFSIMMQDYSRNNAKTLIKAHIIILINIIIITNLVTTLH